MSIFKILLASLNKYIKFEDADTKASLLSIPAINTNGDNNISYKEAAEYNISPTTITIAGESFKEFRYFTGIGVCKIIGANLKIIYIPTTFTGNSQISPFVNCPLLETLGIFGSINLHNATPFGNSWVLKNVIVFGQPSDIIKSSVGNLGWFGGTSHGQGKFYDKNNQEINTITVEDNNFTIAQSILMKCKSINTIHGNNKLVTVNNRAFENSVLSSIDGLDNLTSIGMNAFSGTLLTTFIADNVTNPILGSFGNCTNLETVSLSKVTVLSPSTVSDHGAFSGCTNLVNVNIPNLTTIGKKSFHGCTKLETLETSGITTIGDQAFMNCTKFDSKDFNNVTSIGICAFYSSGLTEVEFKNANFTTTPSDTNANQNYGVFHNCTSLTKIDAPNLINIGKRTFYYCNKLVNANIGWNNVTNIKSEAFTGCSSLPLTDWTIPDSLVEIGTLAFGYSNISGTLTIPSTSSLTELSISTFRNSKISSIIINNPNITTIPTSCFYNCSQITSVNAPYITVLGADGLGCDIPCLSRAIDLPVLKKAGDKAFRRVSGTLNIPNIEEVGEYCFLDSNATPTITPSKLKIVGNAARLRTNALEFSSLIKISGLGILNSNSYIILSNETFPDGQSIVEYSPYVAGNGSTNYIQPVCDSANSSLTSSLRIVYVPDSLLSLYLADTKWTRMCNNTGVQIKAISELNSQ